MNDLRVTDNLTGIGIVLVGRNEAARLPAAISSVQVGVPLVYVDSQSTDASVHIAESAGVMVVRYGGAPSAAAARAAGFDALLACHPEIQFVQFMDADCELSVDWLSHAVVMLRNQAHLGAVWGVRQEIHPDATLWNLICDLEWRVPRAGQTSFFGGDVLLLVAAYRAARGYDAAMIASEDHELSRRVLSAGFHIERTDAPMTRHDVRMSSLLQYWRRNVRRGVGVGQMVVRHRQPLDVRKALRCVFWSLVLPPILVLLSGSHPVLALIALVYPLRWFKIFFSARAFAWSTMERAVWATHCLAADLPNAVGLISFAFRRAVGSQPKLVEYHAPASR